MDRGPGVGQLRERGVRVEDVGLHGQDDGHDDEGDGEEAQEARAREPGRGGGEDGGEGAAVFAQAVEGEEGVVGGGEAEDRGPDEEQGDAGPGVVDGGGAARDGEEVVPRGLDDVVDDDDVEGRAEAEGAVEQVAPEALLAGGGDGGLAGVEGAGERAGDAEDGAHDREGGGEVELDFDVAEDGAGEPGGDVVVGPEEGVDEVHEIRDEDPEDEAAGGEVAVLDMPDEGREVEEYGEERKERNGDGGWRKAQLWDESVHGSGAVGR